MTFFATLHLFRAARRGDVAGIRRTVRSGAHLEANGPQGLTPLMIAANGGHVAALRALVELGADVNASATVSYPGTTSGFTALMAAACDSTGQVAPVEALLELGADPTAADDRGRTAATYAEISGYSALVAVLRRPPVV